MFLSGAVVAIDELTIRVEVPHRDFAMIRSHGAERANQAAAGTCFGCGLCRQQVCAGTVLAEEGRQHVSGVADLSDQIGDIVKLVLALLIGFLHHADFRLGKTVILLVLLLHLLVELVEVTLRIGDWLQIKLPFRTGKIGIGKLLHRSGQRWQCLLCKVVHDFRHALHSGDVTADERHFRSHVP